VPNRETISDDVTADRFGREAEKPVGEFGRVVEAHCGGGEEEELGE